MAIIQCTVCGHKFVRSSQRNCCPLCQQPIVSEEPASVYTETITPLVSVAEDANPVEEEDSALSESRQKVRDYQELLCGILDELLAADSWDNVRAVIERHQQYLLVSEHLSAIEQLVPGIRSNGYPDIAEHLDMYCIVLRDSIKRGLDLAWTDFIQKIDESLEALRDLMLAHIQPERSVRQVLLEKQDLFLSPLVVAAMYRSINRFGSGTTLANAHSDYLLHLLLDAREGKLPSDDQQFPPVDEQKLSPDGRLTMFSGVTGLHPDDPIVKESMQTWSRLNTTESPSENKSAYADLLVEIMRALDFSTASVTIKPGKTAQYREKLQQFLPYVDRATQPLFWASIQNQLNMLPALDETAGASIAKPNFSAEEAPVQWAQAHIVSSFFEGANLKDKHQLAKLLADFNIVFKLLDPTINPDEWNFALLARVFIQVHQRTSLTVPVLIQAMADVEQAGTFFTRERSLENWAMMVCLHCRIRLQLLQVAGDAEKNTAEIIEVCTEIIDACRNGLLISLIYYEALMLRAQAHVIIASRQAHPGIVGALADLNILLHEDKECLPLTDYWATVQETMGTIYSSMPDPDLRKSITCFDQALRVFTPDNDRIHWANVIFLRAHVYSTYTEGSVLRNREKALEDLLLVCDDFTPEVSAIRWAILHGNLGNLYAVRLAGERHENFEQAIEHYNQALTVVTYEDYPSFWAIALTGRATAYRVLALPDVNNAQSYMLSPQEMLMRSLRPLDHGNFIQDFSQTMPLYYKYMRLSLQDLELVLSTLSPDQYPHEWSYARREFVITKNFYAIQHNATEDSKQAQSDFDEVLRLYEQRGLRYDWAATLNNRAAFSFFQIENGQLSAAKNALRDISSSLTVFTHLAFPREYRALHLLRARVYYYLELWEEAHVDLLVVREVLRQALLSAPSSSDLFAEISEIAIQNIYVYDALILVRMARYSEAVLALEEGRAQSFRLVSSLDAIVSARTDGNVAAQQRSQSFLTARDTWRKQQQSVNIQMQQGSLSPEEKDAATTQLEQTWLTLLQCAEAIRDNDDPEFMHVTPTMQEIEQALTSPDEALVYIANGGFLAATHGIALIVSRGADRQIQLRYLDLPRLTLQAVFDLLEPDVDADLPICLSKALSTLGPVALDSVAQALQEQSALRRVYLIPYGHLGLFPLPSVHISSQSGGCTFGELFEVTLMPSAHEAKLSAMHIHEVRKEEQLLVVGNPQPLAEGYQSLPYAEAEAEVVAHLARKHGYQPYRLRMLLGEQATRTRIVEELQHTWYAHFAMHGEYLAYDPLASQLIFAGSDDVPESERTLSLREILDGRIDLHGLRLVVLSACETSLIDVRHTPNEGLGMAAGFLQAGVAGVIASLWRVNDRATYLLMTRFADLYFNRSLHLTPAQALVQAQHWLREEATYQVLAHYKPQLLNFTIQRLSENQHDILTRIRDSAKNEELYHPMALPYADPRYWSAFTITGR